MPIYMYRYISMGSGDIRFCAKSILPKIDIDATGFCNKLLDLHTSQNNLSNTGDCYATYCVVANSKNKNSLNFVEYGSGQNEIVIG